MKLLRRSLAFVVLAAVWACTTSKDASSPEPVLGDGGITPDGTVSGGSGSVCATSRDYIVRCAGEDELDCGQNYDAWCRDKDQKLNSEAFRKAEQSCLPTVGCDTTARHDCEYKSYSGQELTDAQKSLVEAYCATCEPSDVSGCGARAVTYDAAAGPGKVSDIFIAAWELADPIVDQIREKCTGTALPPGSEPCAERFGSCAAGPYLDNVPDCP